jgi:hypothetical protein
MFIPPASHFSAQSKSWRNILLGSRAQLASLPVQVHAMVAEPVADRCTKYSIMLRYIAPRMARAVVVIDPIFGRFVDLINGIEVLYFRHGNFFRN